MGKLLTAKTWKCDTRSIPLLFSLLSSPYKTEWWLFTQDFSDVSLLLDPTHVHRHISEGIGRHHLRFPKQNQLPPPQPTFFTVYTLNQPQPITLQISPSLLHFTSAPAYLGVARLCVRLRHHTGVSRRVYIFGSRRSTYEDFFDVSEDFL